MSAITTHMLDTAAGCPASGVDVVLEERNGDAWLERGSGSTDADGRLATLLPEGEVPSAGTWRLHFHLAAWAAAQQRECFHPTVTIEFVIKDPTQHYHVPLLWSPFGYSTYRGS